MRTVLPPTATGDDEMPFPMAAARGAEPPGV